MKHKIKRTVKYIIGISLMFLFLYFAFKGTDLDQLWNTLKNANYWWVIAMLPILLISHALRAWRWGYLLKPIKKDISFRNLYSALLVGYSVNNILPRAGELVRPYAIGKSDKISRSAAFGTVLMERILDILSFMVMISLIPLVYTGPLTQTFPWLKTTGIWITVVTLTVFLLLVFLMLHRNIVVKILNFFIRDSSTRLARLVSHITHSFLDGFLFLKEPKNYFAIAVLSVFVWALYIIMMYLPFFAFDLDQKHSLDMGAAMVVQAISSIGIMMPTPGATGTYHYFTIETLTKLYGVDKELAVSYATVTHAVGFIGITLLGFFCFIKDNLNFADVMKQENSTISKTYDQS